MAGAAACGGARGDRFLRQCRLLAIKEMDPQDLTESDKLNGFEWVGRATMKPTFCREAGGLGGMVLDGMSNTVVSRQRGRWSQWWISRRGQCASQTKTGCGNFSGMVRICAERCRGRRNLRTPECSRKKSKKSSTEKNYAWRFQFGAWIVGREALRVT
jgi:hypothetical protein